MVAGAEHMRPLPWDARQEDGIASAEYRDDIEMHEMPSNTLNTYAVQYRPTVHLRLQAFAGLHLPPGMVCGTSDSWARQGWWRS
ncbi:hypothetical protein NX059_000736 [Plenodomus lindquistii]|nr:hypothetical protein NX059_000736 [Plenodomus lindquistii]